jgi:TolB-like protein
MGSEEISFGRFRLRPDQRELRRDGQPVRVHPRALGILCALAEAKGETVSKDELMARLWPGRIVEEGNLHVHVSALRRALDEHGGGHSYIVTVPGRGYRLAGVIDAFGVVPSTTQILPLPDKPSIAVLPFANLSGDPEQGYFADGMVDEIITALSRIRWLFVIARNSTFSYKGQAIDVKQVGCELGVRYVLEGSVRKGGGRVRITAQLIEAETGAHLWADRFDGSLDDIFDLQDQVAASVAGVIEPTLETTEIRRSERQPTRDLGAYDLYLRALPILFSFPSEERVVGALALVKQAIERDPHYAPALGLAAWASMRLYDYGQEREARHREGIRFAHQALAEAADDPNVLANAANALAFLGEDLDTQIDLIDRALALNPSFARGWYQSGSLRVWAGQPELAIDHIKKSLRLNPRGVGGSYFWVLGIANFFLRRFDEAVRLMPMAIQQTPAWPWPYRGLASCYAHLGRFDEARRIILRLPELTSEIEPTRLPFRRDQDRELFLSGLRLAVGERDQ